MASATWAREPSTEKFAAPPVRDHAPPVSALPHPLLTVRLNVSAAMTLLTVTACVTLSVALALFVIFNVTWYVAEAFGNVCVGDTPLPCGEPSPKSQS